MHEWPCHRITYVITLCWCPLSLYSVAHLIAWGFLTSTTLQDLWLRLAHTEPESPLCSLTLEIRGDSGGQGRYKEQSSRVLQKCAYSNVNVFIKSFIMLEEITIPFFLSKKIGSSLLVVLLMYAWFSLTLVSVVHCEGFQIGIQMPKPLVNLWSIAP